MKKQASIFWAILGVGLLFSGQAFGQAKVGYLNSQKILEKYKEAQDVRKQLEEMNKGWEQEAQNMQRELQELSEKLETQSLLLSEAKKAERQQEGQLLLQKLQKFQAEKWGPQGQLVQEEAKLLKPIQDKIIKAINKVGETDGYDYIFDTVTANIVFASKKQTDLTDRVVAELEKGAGASK